MRLYRDPDHVNPPAAPGEPPREPLWVTLGTFDGLHAGHTWLINRLRECADESRGRSMVITFEVHPRVVLKHRPPRPILSLAHKLRLLAGTGVDATLLLRFNEELSRVEPEEFIRDWLVRRLNVAGVVLGYDARFGDRALGDFDMLARFGRELCFATVQGEPVKLPDGEVVSSTGVREALSRLDAARAAAMLTRPFSVLGRVVHGKQLGRELGFPTANIRMHHDTLLPLGIYAVRVRDAAGNRLRLSGGDAAAEMADSADDHPPSLLLPEPGVWGAASIGIRPTVNDDHTVAPLLEIHLLDWTGDLYGRRLDVEFHHYIRPEWKFASLDELKERIAHDCRDVTRWVAANGAVI